MQVTTITGLSVTWFALIGLLWAGYLVLEGFDFGVSMVAPLVSRDDLDRRLCLNAIGPVWDGNEVWLLVAGGATFAAFPLWYAKLFSGAYLALFLVLLALIVRGVSFEFRGKLGGVTWRRAWDAANVGGSLVAALIWGVAFTNFAHGLPLTPNGYTGGLFGLLHPLAVVGGLAALLVFAFHGSVFLALKTDGDLRVRARRLAVSVGAGATLLTAATVVWLGTGGRPWAGISPALPGAVPLGFAMTAVLLLALGVTLISRRHEGWAFGATALAILLLVGAVWGCMYPMTIAASSGGVAPGLPGIPIAAAASQPYTLTVMTVVAGIFTPFVLAYQGWTYWVFRQRLTRPPASRTAPQWASRGGGPSDGPPGAPAGAASPRVAQGPPAPLAHGR
ncbi:MAG TPA: cytochrome d ubiquinol oxidase subunit II [Candidatus Binatia bacterium]|nr:cytochrome d ubiquinol oxidase subunit II [Candidatus Binatia bacterium]